jgi:hypothetical protein
MNLPTHAPTHVRLMFAALLLGSCQNPSALAQATTDAEQAAVMLPVQALFDFISSKNPAAGQAALLPDARVTAVRQQDGKPLVRSISQPEFLNAISQAKQDLRERYWNPEVRIHGSVADVTTPYDFWRDSKFSHCGMNLIQLVKTDEGWRISAITYSSLAQCDASPLGPMKP